MGYFVTILHHANQCGQVKVVTLVRGRSSNAPSRLKPAIDVEIDMKIVRITRFVLTHSTVLVCFAVV